MKKPRTIAKGDKVRHPQYVDATGFVTKCSDKGGTHFVYVEWGGFPPDVPTDGWARLAKLIKPDRTNLSMKTEVEWMEGTPEVPEGRERTFWCAIRQQFNPGDVRVVHRFLQYANKYVMPLNDGIDEPPKTAVPVGDNGDYEWTGWFESSCDQCDTQWTFSGEVIAWMKLPKCPKEITDTAPHSVPSETLPA